MAEKSELWNMLFTTGYSKSQMREVWEFGNFSIFDYSNSTVKQILRRFAIVDTVLITLSLLLNIVVIVMICSSKGGRAVVSMCACSIAVSNLIITVFVHPSSILVWFLPEIVQPIMCKLSDYFDCWMCTTIAYTILALDVDRYMALTSADGSKSLSGHCMFYLSFVWFFAAAYSAWDLVFEYPEQVTILDAQKNVSVKVCRHTGKFRTLEYIFQCMDIVVLFLLPLAIICLLFLKGLKRKYLLLNPTKRQPAGDSNGRWLLTMTVVFTTLYVMCHLPKHALDLYWNTQDIDSFSPRDYSTLITLRTLKYSSCFTLPIIYLICGHEVKALMHRLLNKNNNLAVSNTRRSLLPNT